MKKQLKKQKSKKVIGPKTFHSRQRAEERYNIIDFVPTPVIHDILDDKCIHLEENFDKYSRKFLVRYKNRFVVAVTDYQVEFVKTVLPFNNDFNLINKLLEKINRIERKLAC